ncbi:nucleotidyltransferase family protein [Paenibacillus alkalitolerans]|uniref:nucleotidyltransferase family protein n=1 Tax=Paenibacillus alkalitolerans TaxID=2799335 RepID=UPI002D7EDB9E|nr:nucleotidyltransferase family protein [Paenibacillus alkalitolerans]
MAIVRDIFIDSEMSIIRALEMINRGAMRIALVIDENDRLIGTVTDGDVRRGILRNVTLEAPVRQIMNNNPVVCRTDDSRQVVLNRMKEKRLEQIPIVDQWGRVVRLDSIHEYLAQDRITNPVVLMAGGLGSRLSPLTDEVPKPLLKVGSKPILETIIENFLEQGFVKFFISVNYKADMIMDYFKDGADRGIEISYIREQKRLGTAGALSLFRRESVNEPVIVMNGDLLTKMDYRQLLQTHLETKAKATMAVREYEFQIPYGVVSTDGTFIQSIEEKPVQKFFVNGGIYVIEPESLRYVPEDTFFDMPSLFDHIIGSGEKTAVFPIRDYWLDIGRMEDFQRANLEYGEGAV